MRAITPISSQEVLFTLGYMNATQRDVIFMHTGLDNSGNFIKSAFIFKTWYPGSMGMKFDTRMMGVSVVSLEQNLLVTLADMTNMYQVLIGFNKSNITDQFITVQGMTAISILDCGCWKDPNLYVGKIFLSRAVLP